MRISLMTLIAALCILNPAVSNAGVIVLYPFSTDLNPTVLASDVTPTLSLGTLSNAYIGTDGFGNVLEAYPTSGSTSPASALANNSFFTLTLSITPGTFGPLDVEFDVAKGGSSDPRGYFVTTSLDGFATDVLSQTLPSGANQAPAPESFIVDATGQSSVSFRFYVWTPTPPLGSSYSVDFSNLEVDSVPEPSTLLLCGFALLGIAFYRSRWT